MHFTFALQANTEPTMTAVLYANMCAIKHINILFGVTLVSLCVCILFLKRFVCIMGQYTFSTCIHFASVKCQYEAVMIKHHRKGHPLAPILVHLFLKGVNMQST